MVLRSLLNSGSRGNLALFSLLSSIVDGQFLLVRLGLGLRGECSSLLDVSVSLECEQDRLD